LSIEDLVVKRRRSQNKERFSDGAGTGKGKRVSVYRAGVQVGSTIQ
jgi:hypothetical protein